MTYKRDQRRRKIRRMREQPHMFKNDVAIGSFNKSKRRSVPVDTSGQPVMVSAMDISGSV